MNLANGQPLRRAVVTGGAGFVGSHLCDSLREKEIEVVCVDNFHTGVPGNVEHLEGDPGFQLVEADVCEPIAVEGIVDAVFHLACPASPRDYQRSPVETLLTGSTGTFNALTLAEKKGARFLLASTSEVYGQPLEHPQLESYWGNVNPIGLRSSYDEAKRFAEALTMAFLRKRGLNASIVRIFNTYGPRMRPEDGRAVPTFISQAIAEESITVTGDGTQTRSMCYVSDTVRGILAVAAGAQSGPFNLGNPHEISMIDLAGRIRELCKSSSEIVDIDLPVDDPLVRRPDISLISEAVGWSPVIDLTSGLSNTIEWFRGQNSSSQAGRSAQIAS
jgi:dTDP-glucose 4,6-dehydratase